MAERFAARFYASWEWRRCREDYARSKGGLCERCAAKGLIVPGTQVHHKIRLTPETLKDPSIAFNWENLEILCDECHRQEHHPVRWRCDGAGHVEL